MASSTGVGPARSNLTFNAPSNCWLAEGQCIVGNNYQAPVENGKAIRTWVAPHDGSIHIEGHPARVGSRGDGFAVSVLRNTEELWASQLISPQTESTSLDLAAAVRKGDEVSFVVEGVKIDARNDKVAMNSSAKLAPASPAASSDTLEVNGGIEEFQCGMTCHSSRDTAVDLPGPGKTFSALIGVNTETSNDAPPPKSAVFSVLVGGKSVFRTDPLKAGTEAVSVNVDLKGARGFVLEVSDAGEGIGLDWARWFKAVVTLSDGKRLWLSNTLASDVTGNQTKVIWDPVVTYSSF